MIKFILGSIFMLHVICTIITVSLTIYTLYKLYTDKEFRNKVREDLQETAGATVEELERELACISNVFMPIENVVTMVALLFLLYNVRSK